MQSDFKPVIVITIEGRATSPRIKREILIMAQDITAIMAFSTDNNYNRLDEKQQVKLIARLTSRFDGATLTEHMGGYTMADGSLAVEYSYTIELFGLSEGLASIALQFFKDLANDNNQESIIVNGSFITTD